MFRNARLAVVIVVATTIALPAVASAHWAEDASPARSSATSAYGKNGIELTFVRSWFKKKPKVTHPARSVRKRSKTVRVITVAAKGKTILLRDGKRLVKLFPRDED